MNVFAESFWFSFVSTKSCSRYDLMHSDQIVGGYILENEFEKCIKLVSKIFSSQTFFTFLRKKQWCDFYSENVFEENLFNYLLGR